jgi:hypothetical protein
MGFARFLFFIPFFFDVAAIFIDGFSTGYGCFATLGLYKRLNITYFATIRRQLTRQSVQVEPLTQTVL